LVDNVCQELFAGYPIEGFWQVQTHKAFSVATFALLTAGLLSLDGRRINAARIGKRILDPVPADKVVRRSHVFAVAPPKPVLLIRFVWELH